MWKWQYLFNSTTQIKTCLYFYAYFIFSNKIIVAHLFIKKIYSLKFRISVHHVKLYSRVTQCWFFSWISVTWIRKGWEPHWFMSLIQFIILSLLILILDVYSFMVWFFKNVSTSNLINSILLFESNCASVLQIYVSHLIVVCLSTFPGIFHWI